ncbi:MAG TPA: hypothetical protein VHE61_14035 [Opitutaceae bacterium]|nr:hypothetical protein [Opitutaceae bacterium]
MAHGPESAAGGYGEWRPGSIRGAAGFYQVAQTPGGQWWLLDPEGRRCFARIVHGVSTPAPDTPFARDPAVRLREWGFNAVGLDGDGAGREDGLASIEAVGFVRLGGAIHVSGVRLPDVFAPDWPQQAATHAAAVCGPCAAHRELIGWVADEDVTWGSPPAADRPGLLQICLSLEPAFAAYHAAWEFALALHGGALASLARAWGVLLPNKETLREMTRGDAGITTRGYVRDDARWSAEFARRYFSTTSAAIRAADPNHLCLGCRFRPLASPAVFEAAAYPSVDVVLIPWNSLPPAGAPTGPILADDVAWAGEAFAGPADAAGAAAAGARSRRLRLTSVERMLRRGRTLLQRLARHPAVVGYAWRQWLDEPAEQPPFARGLVHPNGAEAREHTDLLSDFNLRVENLRRSAARQLSP